MKSKVQERQWVADIIQKEQYQGYFYFSQKSREPKRGKGYFNFKKGGACEPVGQFFSMTTRWRYWPRKFGCRWVEPWGSTIHLFQKGTYNLGRLRGREKEGEIVLWTNFYKYIDMKYTKTSTTAQKISHCHSYKAAQSPSGKPQPSAWTLGYAGLCPFRSFNDNTS